MVIYVKFDIYEDGPAKKYKSFKELLEDDNYNDIEYLQCSNNNLIELPRLPRWLKILHCCNNKINIIGNLPDTLTFLNCSNNNIRILENLPNKLEKLICSGNKLTRLVNLPDSIRVLRCSNNLLKIIDMKLLNKYKGFIHYENNPLIIIIKEKFGGLNEYKKFYLKYKESAKIIEDWYLECKYNPRYKYCRDRLNKEYDELILNNY